LNGQWGYEVLHARINWSGGKDEKMKIDNFEDLNVYKQSRELTKEIYKLTRKPIFSQDRSLTNQMRRASVSIMSNIAEGFERETTREFIRFLYISKGSAGEIRVQIMVALDQAYISEKLYAELLDRTRRIGGMLSNLISYLKQSPYKKRR